MIGREWQREDETDPFPILLAHRTKGQGSLNVVDQEESDGNRCLLVAGCIKGFVQDVDGAAGQTGPQRRGESK